MITWFFLCLCLCLNLSYLYAELFKSQNVRIPSIMGLYNMHELSIYGYFYLILSCIMDTL